MPSKPSKSERESYARSVSTRVVWKAVKIASAPQGKGKKSAKPSIRPFVSSREWRRPVTLTVSYRGNATPWFEVRARGRVWWVQGHDAFLEVMLDIYEGTVRRPT